MTHRCAGQMCDGIIAITVGNEVREARTPRRSYYLVTMCCAQSGRILQDGLAIYREPPQSDGMPLRYEWFLAYDDIDPSGVTHVSMLRHGRSVLRYIVCVGA